MAIHDLFSKRQKKLRGDVPEILTYDDIPNKLRIQIILIIKEVTGNPYSMDEFSKDFQNMYEKMYSIICGENGFLEFGSHYKSKDERVFDYFLALENIEESLDIVEFYFNYFYEYKTNFFEPKFLLDTDEAIEDLNTRFKENGVGYSFENGQIIRVDSTYIHSEITKPTLMLLNNVKFDGPNQEYLNAHEHYKNGKNKECLNECLKAFESTLKTICDEKTWIYNSSDTAKKLIKIFFDNGLIPVYMQNQFSSLQNLFESGVPTLRNKNSGHGQGQTPITVDGDLARYTLNLTGSNIIFLIERSGIK